MTDNLTEELARLNALNQRVQNAAKIVTLMHDENERLKALLVECEKAFSGVTAYGSDEDYGYASHVKAKLHAARIKG